MRRSAALDHLRSRSIAAMALSTICGSFSMASTSCCGGSTHALILLLLVVRPRSALALALVATERPMWARERTRATASWRASPCEREPAPRSRIVEDAEGAPHVAPIGVACRRSCHASRWRGREDCEAAPPERGWFTLSRDAVVDNCGAGRCSRSATSDRDGGLHGGGRVNCTAAPPERGWFTRSRDAVVDNCGAGRCSRSATSDRDGGLHGGVRCCGGNEGRRLGTSSCLHFG